MLNEYSNYNMVSEFKDKEDCTVYKNNIEYCSLYTKSTHATRHIAIIANRGGLPLLVVDNN